MIAYSIKTKLAVFLLVCLVFGSHASAGVVEYELTIAQEEINFTGKKVEAMTINGSIPGPTLRFNEGDIARIHVHNKMSVETSIHWHGLLVPPDMDGVPYMTFPPIRPSTIFTYEFPIRQSGTYWYHSHTNLQEQRGLYGSIVIEPKQERLTPDRDYVLVLSDWTNENPHEVIRTLKRGSEWYAIQKGSGQSILGATRLGLLDSYFTRELLRMPPMDISDVAYDRFLSNGKPEASFPANSGETIRLRIIDGSATTFFHLEFAGGPMTIVAADGQDVEPVEEERFLIGVAETYDVLITIPHSGSFELRATAHDASGHTSVWIGSGKRSLATSVPKPNLYHTMGKLNLKRILALTPADAMGMSDAEVEKGKFDNPGMMGMGPMNMGTMHGKGEMPHKPSNSASENHHHSGVSMNQPVSEEKHLNHKVNHNQPKIPPDSRIGNRYGTNFSFLATDISSFQPLAADGMGSTRPWPPYAKLRAVTPTAFPSQIPVKNIRLTLDGDMERYVWFLNNKTLSETDSIRIRRGEVARFIMINRTMMHHPMHLHGHFFRVINGQGDHAPLKHTVNVAPMSTTMIEFNANEMGDWFFHCHLLYHMKSGMSRMVHYDDFQISPELAEIRPKLYKDPWYFFGQADILSNMTEGFLSFSNTRNILEAHWEAGWQSVEHTEGEAIITWDRYIDRFFSIFGGLNIEGESGGEEDTEGIFGIHYLLPLNVESMVWVDTEGDFRFALDKEFEITPRLALFGDIEYDTHDAWEGSVGFEYTVTKNFSFVARWHSEFKWGAGVQVRF